MDRGCVSPTSNHSKDLTRHTVKKPQNKNSVTTRRSDAFSEKEKHLVLINSMENYNEIGSVIEGQVFGKPSKILLNTGAKVNIISLKRFRELIPGVVVLEPTK